MWQRKGHKGARIGRWKFNQPSPKKMVRRNDAWLSPPVFLDGLYVMLCSTSGFGFHFERRLPPAS
jgi:hypothetical protein